jgi:D-amino-acid oxidase
MMKGERILVLGAGVIGLTTALVLRRRGWSPTVLADRFAPHITSSVAGALWEYPPGVCGKHVDLDRARRWAAASLDAFLQLQEQCDAVFVRPVTFYFRHELTHDPFQQEKMGRLRELIPGFRHDAALIRENGIGPVREYRDAYRHAAPMIDTDRYLAWLMDRVREAGCEVKTRRVAEPLDESAGELLKEFGAAAIVNCAGFGSRELAADPAVYPLRGAVLRIVNDGVVMPRIEEAHCVSHDGTSADPGFVFIVPRGRDRLVLGGFAQPHEEDLAFGPDHPMVKAVFERGIDFLPSLRNAKVDAAEPLRTGLRPAREGGVRLEWDAALSVLHNYGHGGSGVTYSWGCAEEAADLVEAKYRKNR